MLCERASFLFCCCGVFCVLIETLFYCQVFAFFVFLIFGIAFRSWPFFLLAAVFSLLTGAMLAAGEPVEFFTGAFHLEENSDGNMWFALPDVNALTVSNSSPVNMWHYVLLYGGFVWIVVAFFLAAKGRGGIEDVAGR